MNEAEHSLELSKTWLNDLALGLGGTSENSVMGWIVFPNSSIDILIPRASEWNHTGAKSP